VERPIGRRAELRDRFLDHVAVDNEFDLSARVERLCRGIVELLDDDGRDGADFRAAPLA